MANPHITKANKYIAIAATSDRVTEDWGGTSEFTDEALTQLASSAINKPVLLHFDKTLQVGKVISAKNDNGKLTVVFEDDGKANINPRYLDDIKLVPGFIAKQDQWDESKSVIHRIIKKAESVDYGLTHTPLEENLPLIEKYNETTN